MRNILWSQMWQSMQKILIKKWHRYQEWMNFEVIHRLCAHGMVTSSLLSFNLFNNCNKYDKADGWRWVTGSICTKLAQQMAGCPIKTMFLLQLMFCSVTRQLPPYRKLHMVQRKKLWQWDMNSNEWLLKVFIHLSEVRIFHPVLEWVHVFLHLASGLVKTMQMEGRSCTETVFGFVPARVGCRGITTRSKFPNKVEQTFQSMIFKTFLLHHLINLMYQLIYIFTLL